jgi:hypothetical protein
MSPYHTAIPCTWRSSQLIYRRYLVIAIGVCIDSEEVPIYPDSYLLGIVFREMRRTLGR